MPSGSKLDLAKLKLTISNPDKVLYPNRGFTKSHVIAYYHRVAPVLLPHLKGRPVTLKRFPDGVNGTAFYEKDAPSFTPDWVKTFPVARRDPAQPPIQYILVENARTLLWLANLAALELHPFLHRAPRITRPTHCVFDLDPGDGVDILGCIEVAFLLKELFQRLALEAVPKVSGSKGIQIYIPLNTPVSYDQTQPFARAVAELMERQFPDRVVSEMSKVLRKGRVLIDWSQNTIHKTTVSPYSLRAKRQEPFVSLPVAWDELRAAMKSGSGSRLYWEPDAAVKRIEKLGDLFAPVLNLKQKLPRQFIDLANQPVQAMAQAR